MANNLF